MRELLFILIVIIQIQYSQSQNLLVNGHLETSAVTSDDGDPPYSWIFATNSETMCYMNCIEDFDVSCRSVPTQTIKFVRNGVPTIITSTRNPIQIAGYVNNSYVILFTKYNINGLIEQVLPQNLLPNATYRLSFYSSLYAESSNVKIEAALGKATPFFGGGYYAVSWANREKEIPGLKNESKLIQSDTDWEYHFFDFTIPCGKDDLNTIMIRANKNGLNENAVYLDEIELTLIEAPVICYPEFHQPIPNPTFLTETCQSNPFTIFNIENTHTLHLQISTMASGGSSGMSLYDEYISNPSKTYVWNNDLPNGIFTSQNPVVLTYDVELSNDCYTEHYAGNFYYSNSENCIPTPYQVNMQSIILLN
jgi:hypothetical protein